MAVVGLVEFISFSSVFRWVTAVLAHRSQGIDASDEAYSLISANSPDATIARQGNFGYFVQLLRQLSGGALGGLRLAGQLTVQIAAGIATWGPRSSCHTPQVNRRASCFSVQHGDVQPLPR